ncbi:MAG: DUF3574 domain-containing protein [Alphaproteobacteria bacterium]|nr:DUF3574 domain-containing protein [Alphaproteobacteria bacterium]
MKRILASLAVTLALSACASAPACRTQTALFLGSAIGSAGESVSETDWECFLADAVVARFPDGFTVLEATGVYRQRADGALIRERTRILLFVHPDDEGTGAAIAAIAEDYKRRFRQESVLKVEQCASFAF